MLVRKLGGWTFHELNVPLADLKKFTANGPDLSYDFVTRAQCLHALLTGDAGPLRLAFRWMLEAGVQPRAFVHDLQNHDEITYQLVEPEERKDELFVVSGKKLSGRKLKDTMLEQMREKAAGEAAPYNKLYRPERDGVATTFAGFVAPALGINDPYMATPEQVKTIARGHLLLAAANALIPGVFALSSWDLVGALPIPLGAVEDRVGGGDFRWVNRGAVDLLGANPRSMASAIGLARAKTLYGPLPEQLRDTNSFASQLKVLLAARRKHKIAEGELLAVPEPKAVGLCILVLKLPGEVLAVSAFNFGREEVEEDLDLSDILPESKAGGKWRDVLTGRPTQAGTDAAKPRVRLRGLSGTTFVLGSDG
jgi:maltose alpha-D-glucosyltransferase/alpha-amylase